MTGPTREVLGLAQHRIIGLVHGQLRSSERTRDSYFSLFQSYDADPRPEPDLTSKPGPIGTLDVTAHLNRLTEESFTHPDFVESLAESLPKEFASLLWAKLVESVIVDPLCDFVRFAQFYRAYKGSAMVISFEPAINELTYPKSAPPRIEEFFGAEKASEERMDIRCRQFLTTSLSGPPLSMSNSGDSSSLYPLALPELLRLGLPSLASDVLGSQPTLAGSAIKHDAISAISHATALYTYYAWISAFWIHLSLSRELTVSGIGRFYLDKTKLGIEVISFQADERFHTIVRTNAPEPASDDDLAAA